MIDYWEIRPTAPRRSSFSAVKLLAVVVILIIVMSSGLMLLLQIGPFSSGGQVRVAVLDSGVNSSGILQGRVVAAKSFISTEYGYSTTDLSTGDSRPDGTPHGTLVAMTVAEESQNSLIVNGRILALDGTATTPGLIAAIYWAVEQNCSVINLSLGSTPTYNDPTEEAVQYAFSKGVVVVAAAGNEGDSGNAGTSISSPGVFMDCLAVAAIDDNSSPFYFSSTGPTASRYMKPDIAALGYTETSTSIYYGTSFSSPRVSAAAAELIAYCITNNRPYTPGSIMTALLKGADTLPYPAYDVGAGAVNVENSIAVIASSPDTTKLPNISYASPTQLPIDFEKLFCKDTYEFSLRLFTSSQASFDVQIDSSTPSIFDVPSPVTINQVGSVPLKVTVPASGATSYDGNITFVSDTAGSANVRVHFTVSNASARVAFDISHTTWSIDTIYGQFRELYKKLTSNAISVTELRNKSDITYTLLSGFDAVLLLDPCAWDIDETDAFNPFIFSVPFSSTEIEAYHQYFDNGGGIFVVALSNDSLDIHSLNDFLTWSNFSLKYNTIEVAGEPVLVTDVTPHTATTGVSNFDYYGAGINVPGGATTLGTYVIDPVLACLQGAGGGRMVVSGSNFQFDNYGMTSQYQSLYDATLALNIVLWLTHII